MLRIFWRGGEREGEALLEGSARHWKQGRLSQPRGQHWERKREGKGGVVEERLEGVRGERRRPQRIPVPPFIFCPIFLIPRSLESPFRQFLSHLLPLLRSQNAFWYLILLPAPLLLPPPPPMPLSLRGFNSSRLGLSLFFYFFFSLLLLLPSRFVRQRRRNIFVYAVSTCKCFETLR